MIVHDNGQSIARFARLPQAFSRVRADASENAAVVAKQQALIKNRVDVRSSDVARAPNFPNCKHVAICAHTHQHPAVLHKIPAFANRDRMPARVDRAGMPAMGKLPEHVTGFGP